MNAEHARRLNELLATRPPILLIPHKNPDGDAIGSCLGLMHYLQAVGHQVSVLAPNDFPQFLQWMPGASEVIRFDRQPEAGAGLIREAGLIFTLDFNALDRSGALAEPLKQATAPMVMIDHHQSPDDYATVTYSDPSMSSTCEMVYHCIAALGGIGKLNADAASCLYAGLLTDTGSFKFPSTSPITLRIAADLMERGAVPSEIHRQIYDTNRPERIQLLGCALSNLKILPQYRTAYITLSQEELDRHNFRKGDTEGFVNYGLSLDGVILAAIFIENTDEEIVKISLRSQGDFSVNAMARAHFEGGGHINAAGGRSTESLKETTLRFESILSEYAKDLQP
ncbi:phosphoesterase RecJ domain-containing protein [Robiginitalea myxolifaciens]|uniref:Phosphoesterase RecJ domain-containing protein n=1 Tax=Robiginitalea myxolifaciens TaxID=400055 RepID=A0A1I6FNA9_9FLAO|nr:bifunctional oligoribonuclease/PAP phosphatase NrnA [Robiginitalea myxolifaciens]SFR31445.1 phosphoesterase RecJ domain-containing protein [Robiginitalea myxolifaciens]